MAFLKSASRPPSKLKDNYDTWSFRNRSFLSGLYVSFLWHVFCFFVFQITVGPKPLFNQYASKTQALRPVLTDELLRSIVDSRPDISQAYYEDLQIPDQWEKPEQSGPALEPITPTGTFAVSSAEHARQRLRKVADEGVVDSADETYATNLSSETKARPALACSVTGISPRDIVSRPPEPTMLSMSGGRKQAVIRIRVNDKGLVREAVVTRSSEDNALDASLLEYSRRWIFITSAMSDEDRQATLTFIVSPESTL